MTLTTIILWIATSILFAITNSISYKRGNDSGYIEGVEDAMQTVKLNGKGE